MQNYFFIKDRIDYVQIRFSDILYIETVNRYVRFVTSFAAYLTEGSLCELEAQLPSNEFCRIHRSHIVSLNRIKRFNTKEVTIGDKQLPVGKRYWHALSAKVLVVFRDSLHVKKVRPNVFSELNHN